MTLDPRQLAAVVQEAFDNLPHPKAPALTNAEYPVYERIAAMMRNPDEPVPSDVEAAYHQLKHAGITPSQWEHAWTISRPVANRLLGRDPTLQELIRHGDAHPSEIHDYYWHSPSSSHPEIKAGEMAKYMHIASQVAPNHVDWTPTRQDAAYFAAAGMHPSDVEAHYQRLAQEQTEVDQNAQR